MKRLSLIPALCALILSAPAFAAGDALSPDYVNILENRLASLEQQVQNLTNQTEQAAFQAKQAQDRLARLEEDMNTRFRMLESNAAAAPASAPANADATVPLASATDRNAPAPANSDQKNLGEMTGGKIELPNDPNVAYDQAFSKVRDGDYQAAEAAMRAFIAKWPKNELSSNASYWLGETFYVRGDFTAAAKAFAEGYQTYPKGAKAEDTLLKLGLSLSSLNRPGDACVAFDQLRTSFPRMSATTKRRLEDESAKLDCPKPESAPISTVRPRTRGNAAPAH